MALVVKHPPANAGDVGMWVQSLDWEGPLEKGTATPVFLPGESPWTEEPGGLQSRGSQSQTQLKWLNTAHYVIYLEFFSCNYKLTQLFISPWSHGYIHTHSLTHIYTHVYIHIYMYTHI